MAYFCPICQYKMDDYPNYDGRCLNCKKVFKITVLFLSNDKHHVMGEYI